MNLISVSCNHCGAPLEFPDSSKFITCKYCKSNLKIQHSGGAIYSEVLEEIREVSNDVETIKWQNELERVDREWALKRQQFLVTNKNGHSSEPGSSGASGIIGGVLAIIFCIFFMTGSSSMGAPALFSLFPIVMIIIIIFGMIKGSSNNDAYQRAKSEFEQERNNILKKIKLT